MDFPELSTDQHCQDLISFDVSHYMFIDGEQVMGDNAILVNCPVPHKPGTRVP